MPAPAPDPFPEDRVEGRADGQRKPLVERKKRQRQRDDGVDRPRVQRPVIDRGGQAHPLCRLHIRGDDAAILGNRRRHAKRLGDCHVIDGFQHPEEHQPDPHPGREKHREPADIGVIGRRLLPAQADRAQRADDQEQAEADEDVRRAKEEPVEGRGQPWPQPAEEGRRLFRQRQRVKDEGHDGQRRDQKDRVVNVEAERPQIAFKVVLTDRVIGIDDVCVPFRQGNALGVVGIGHLATSCRVVGIWYRARAFQPRTSITETLECCARVPPCEAQM